MRAIVEGREQEVYLGRWYGGTGNPFMKVICFIKGHVPKYTGSHWHHDSSRTDEFVCERCHAVGD